MRTVGIGLLLGAVGCASGTRISDPWFDRAWEEDARNREVQSRDEYLKWVSLFYDGSPFAIGWTRRQAELCAPLDSLQAPQAESRLETLGRLVAAEWAKDNRLRRLGTDLLQRMGSILVNARDAGRFVEVLDALIHDVRSVVAGDLESRAITSERYEKLL